MLKSKLAKALVYISSILLSTFITVNVGSELITQYEVYATGAQERIELADDFGLGFLLMFGLIPEIILGCLIGWFLGRRLNAKLSKNT